jgi:hypothetical protein
MAEVVKILGWKVIKTEVIEVAKVAYNLHTEARAQMNHYEMLYPEWDELTEEIQQAWCSAVEQTEIAMRVRYTPNSQIVPTGSKDPWKLWYPPLVVSPPMILDIKVGDRVKVISIGEDDKRIFSGKEGVVEKIYFGCSNSYMMMHGETLFDFVDVNFTDININAMFPLKYWKEFLIKIPATEVINDNNS